MMREAFWEACFWQIAGTERKRRVKNSGAKRCRRLYPAWMNCPNSKKKMRQTSIVYPAALAESWQKSLHTEKMYGNRLFGVWDFISASLFICWMPMMMWKRMSKRKLQSIFKRLYIIKGFDDRVKSMLMMMMAETCREFEKLPIIKYTDILRNILYSGVWCRFETVSGKRKKEQEKEHV